MTRSEPMPDPVSISAGVLGLLGTCVRVGSTLKDFYDGASFADTKVKGLLTDVESFTQVLRLMKDTFEQEQIRTSMQATGHISSHWNNLSASIRDGQNTVLSLQETLERVDKSVGVLDGARKHLRLKGASEEIENYRLQIQSYRNTLQLSLQTVLLWNQITFKESTDKILPNLEEKNQAIRRIAHDINNRMSTLQNVATSKQTDAQLHVLHNLRNCVQSAASIASSASTSLGTEQPDYFSVSDRSELGGLFPSEPGETMLRWISSNTVYEFEAETAIESPSNGRDFVSTFPPFAGESPESDSDNELEEEILQALIKVGREKFQEKDFEGAERLLRNCLDRISSDISITSLRHSPRPKSDATNLLLDVYRAQEKWDEAQCLLLEKIANESRDKTSDNSCALIDMLILIDVLVQKASYAEAYLYGRRTLKGYRKMGSDGLPGVESSLKALIHICHMNGNYEEEDAYTAILSDFKQLNESTLGAAIVTQSNASRPESSFQATKPGDPPQVRKQELNMSEVERLLLAESPNTAEAYAPSREPLVIREASDANTHQLRTDFGRSGFANTSAVVEKERSFTDTGGQANRDFVTVASNVQRTVSNVSNSAKVRRKLVIVGDTGCGKTALLMAISTGVFQSKEILESDRHINDHWPIRVEVEGKLAELELWDTRSRSTDDGLRSQAYLGSHVILMCFAVDSRDSFDNVQDKWIIEMLKYCKGVPVILVGCKKDLLGDYKAVAQIGKAKQKQVTYEEGEKVRRRMEAWYTYLECSAKTGEGIREVFEYVTRATLINWKLSKEKRPGVFRRMFSRTSS